MKNRLFIIAVVALAFGMHRPLPAQKKWRLIPENVTLRDTLDGGFDMSDFLINANGFIPLAAIITEPAIGGFGGAVAPIFLKKREPLVSEVRGERRVTPIPPDITGVAAFYSLNNSWGVMGMRNGTLHKGSLRYIIAGGYLNMNLSFYRTLPQEGETEFDFNIRMAPAYLSLLKRIGTSKFYAGGQYLFMFNRIKYKGARVASLAGLFDRIDDTRIISQLGGVGEYDSRDNTFTPDRGSKIHLDADFAASAIGSDYDFQKINAYAYIYHPLVEGKLTGGFRIDGQQAFGNMPFYMLPYVDLRGVASGRYQGDTELLTEVELRWDMYKRWSIVGFSGAGKAFNDWGDFGKADLVYNYGTGFRYLVAREFKLRMGVDIAKGPADQWGYYIIFGSSWNR